MNSYYEGGTAVLYCGQAVDVLAGLPAGCVNSIVTSPPYYSQRDYGPGQIGMEATPDEYVTRLVQVLAEARRTLAADGTLWLNLGDTYYSAKGRPHGVDPKHCARRINGLRPVDGPGLGLPRKSLIGIPWRVALGLQADGWTLRSAIIWRRTTDEPEPTAKDRPWNRYETVFLLAKGPRYYFDRTALRGEEDVWTIESARGGLARGEHFATYPPALPERCVLAGTRPGETVLDPFAGSCTTGMVAGWHGRRFIGIDLRADYLDLGIRARLAQGALVLEGG